MKIDVNTEASSKELSIVLGITDRRVRQLTQEGILETKSRGRYNLTESVQRYMYYRAKKDELSANDLEKQEAEVNIKKAKAIVAVMEAKELQGKMHRSEDVAAMTEDLIYTIRNSLQALPGRLAVDVASANSPSECAQIIRKEVYKVMEELSHYRYDAKKYEERVRERRKWDPAVSENHDEEY